MFKELRIGRRCNYAINTPFDKNCSPRCTVKHLREQFIYYLIIVVKLMNQLLKRFGGELM